MTAQTRAPTSASAPVLAAVSVVTVAVFAWVRLAPDSALEALAAYRSGLYLQPWRVITAAFIHHSAPHLLFNLLTLWLLGGRVIDRHGVWWFAAVFVTALVVGQVAQTLLDTSYVYGISGGVCGLYGFLVQREWNGDVRGLLGSWFTFWAYPLALVGLFVADGLGLLPIANINHMVGIAAGWLVGRGFSSGSTRISRAAAVLPVTIALLLTAYRPWDPVWRAVHGVHEPGDVLDVVPCETRLPTPGPEVASASARVVTLLNPSLAPIALEYLGEEGSWVPSLRTSAARRSFRPVHGSIWRVMGRDGVCVRQFIASRDGVVVIG